MTRQQKKIYARLKALLEKALDMMQERIPSVTDESTIAFLKEQIADVKKELADWKEEEENPNRFMVASHFLWITKDRNVMLNFIQEHNLISDLVVTWEDLSEHDCANVLKLTGAELNSKFNSWNKRLTPQ